MSCHIAFEFKVKLMPIISRFQSDAVTQAGNCHSKCYCLWGQEEL